MPATRSEPAWPPAPRRRYRSDIMNQTGHRSADMVRRYIREGNLFNSSNAASSVYSEVIAPDLTEGPDRCRARR
jgi:hypothetical protein